MYEKEITDYFFAYALLYFGKKYTSASAFLVSLKAENMFSQIFLRTFGAERNWTRNSNSRTTAKQIALTIARLSS